MSNAFKLQNATIFVVTEAPGGLYNAEQLKFIADLCERESLVSKVTEDQRLGLIIAEDRFDVISQELQTIGIGLRHYQNGVHQAISCLGANCPLFEQDALSAAMNLTDALANKTTRSPVKIGINGCSAACVPTHTLDFSIIGESGGYRISIGGKNSQIPEMASFIAEGVPAEKLTDMISAAIEKFEAAAQDGETLGELLQREGSAAFVEVFAPYSQDAAQDKDPFSELNPTESAAAKVSADLDLDAHLENIPSSDDMPAIDLNIEPELIESDAPTSGLEPINSSAAVNEVDLNLEDVKFEDDSEMLGNEVQEIDISDIDLELPEKSFSEEFDPAQTEVDNMVNSEVLSFEATDIDANAKLHDLGSQEELDLEVKLEESIAEQKKIAQIETDENVNQRAEALNFIEQDNVTSIRDELATFGEEESLDGNFAYEQDESQAMPSQSKNSHAAGLGMIQSVNINEEFTTLSFSSGGSLTIDIQKLREGGGRRSFTVNGQEVSVRLGHGGLYVAVDGLEISFPEAA